MKLKKKKINVKNNFSLNLLFFILSFQIAFADIATLASNVENQMKSVGEQVLRVVNTAIGSIGFIYTIIVACIFVFKSETFKENSKVLIAGVIALGALYGITRLGLKAFE